MYLFKAYKLVDLSGAPFYGEAITDDLLLHQPIYTLSDIGS